MHFTQRAAKFEVTKAANSKMVIDLCETLCLGVFVANAFNDFRLTIVDLGSLVDGVFHCVIVFHPCARPWRPLN